MQKAKTIVVPENLSGERLQHVLKSVLGEAYSGKRIKQIIDHYGCRVNGKIELFSSYKVHPGDKIQINLDQEATKQNIVSVKILYEDEDLLIWDKPAQTLSDETLHKLFLPRSTHLVHRLDKDTTGVMLLAKNTSMQKLLEELFKKREVEKIYEAIVQGKSIEQAFTVENKLGKLRQYEGQAIWGKKEDGLYALTHFEIVKRTHNYLLVRCFPKTGRTHQIRVHLAEKGLPILGDYHYSREKIFKYLAKRVLLHAVSIQFTHPKTKQLLTVKAHYPEDFYKAVDELF